MRAFSATRGTLLRRGSLVVSLSTLSGNAGPKGCQFSGVVTSKPSYWLAPGVALTLAWQVAPNQPASSWIEADVIVREVATAPEGTRVRLDGTTVCRPHAGPKGDPNV